MKKNLYKLLNSLGLLFLGIWLFQASLLKAQDRLITSEVITTNFDSINNRLYAWMRYAPSGADTCLQAVVDTILFRLQKKDNGVYVPVGSKEGYDVIKLSHFQADSFGAIIDRFYNKGGDVIHALAVTTAKGLPGYGLIFNLEGAGLSITEKDSVMITLETKLPAIRCRWCGVGYSDIMINPLIDVDTLCPYPKTDKDLLFCQKRKGGAKNWEGYIRDPRDCRIYRIVHMPFNTASSNPNEKNKWWFARNLNFQKGMYTTQNFLPGGNAYTKDGVGTTSSPVDNKALSQILDTTEWRGYVYCPQNAGVQATVTSEQTAGEGTATTTRSPYTADVVSTHPGGPWNCEVYGALYSRPTYSKPDGNGKMDAFVPLNATIPTKTFRGVCPVGWSVPADQHWGVMLNAVDGCKTPTTAKLGNAIAGDTCGNFRTDLYSSASATNEILNRIHP
ncbi:MAG: hypothetical protein ACRCSB_05835, partial [Bacteroidales bacterium]